MTGVPLIVAVIGVTSDAGRPQFVLKGSLKQRKCNLVIV